jgi:hypothetical protein
MTGFKRLRRRLSELKYRFRNFQHWRRKGMGIRRAWKKADLTL